MLKTVINNKYILAGWMSEHSVFYYTWKCFVPSQEMKQLLNDVLTHLEAGKCKLMLQDLRTTQAVSADIQEWFATSWFPRAAALGLRKIAVLTPQSVFGQMAVDRVRNKIMVNDFQISTQSFDDEQDAIYWLKNNDMNP